MDSAMNSSSPHDLFTLCLCFHALMHNLTLMAMVHTVLIVSAQIMTWILWNLWWHSEIEVLMNWNISINMQEKVSKLIFRKIWPPFQNPHLNSVIRSSIKPVDGWYPMVGISSKNRILLLQIYLEQFSKMPWTTFNSQKKYFDGILYPNKYERNYNRIHDMNWYEFMVYS